MEDPTKTFEPGKKITLFDKSKQKYAIGALLIKIDESKLEELPKQEKITPPESEINIESAPENPNNSPTKQPNWIQILSIIIIQILWIYLLFIHKITQSVIILIKQKFTQYQNLDF